MKIYITLGLFCLSVGALADGLDVASYGKWADETSDASTDAPDTTSPSQSAHNPLPTYKTAAPVVEQTMAAAPVPAVSSAAPADQSMMDEDFMDDTPENTSSASSDPDMDGPTTGHGVVLNSRVNSKAPEPVEQTYVQTSHSSRNHGGNFWKDPEIEFTLLAGGSGSYIPVNEGLVNTSGFTDPAKYKFHLSGEGFTGGLGVSAGYRRGNNTFGAMFAGYVDSHTLKNYDHKNDIYGGDPNSSLTFLSRSYTLELAAKAGHYFNNLPVVNDVHLYGKLGVICSAFQYKYRNTNVDARKSMTAWGGLLGIGLQKSINLPLLNEAKIGLEYDYHIYQTLTPVIRYDTRIDTSRFRPRYHNGYLTISKSL